MHFGALNHIYFPRESHIPHLQQRTVLFFPRLSFNFCLPFLEFSFLMVYTVNKAGDWVLVHKNEPAVNVGTQPRQFPYPFKFQSIRVKPLVNTGLLFPFFPLHRLLCGKMLCLFFPSFLFPILILTNLSWGEHKRLVGREGRPNKHTIAFDQGSQVQRSQEY